MPIYQLWLAALLWMAAVFLFVEEKLHRVFWLCVLAVLLILHFWLVE